LLYNHIYSYACESIANTGKHFARVLPTLKNMLREGCQLIVATQIDVFRAFGQQHIYCCILIYQQTLGTKKALTYVKRTDALIFYKFASF
jgi:hypothetical protein